jgi:hypothetical protein
MDRDEGEVSFNNDEGDGLAALFGGITPSAEPATEPGPRRTGAVEPEPAAQGQEVSPPPSASPVPASDQPVPQQPVYQPAPAYQAPPAYQPPPAYQAPPEYQAPPPAAYPPPAASAPPAATEAPAWPPASPAYDMPAPAVAPQAPPSYDLAPPAAAPSGNPFAAPPPSYEPPAAQPPAYQPPTDEPPAYEPPAYEPPAYEPQAYQPPAHEAPAYEPPAYEAPTYQPQAYEPPPQQQAPSYDLPAPGAAPYAGAAPAGAVYPPTAQYPAGLDPALAPPAGPTYDLPASAPPAAQPTPLDEPPPYAAPEAPVQYVAPPPSGAAYDAPPVDQAYAAPSPYGESPRPDEGSADEHPLVRAESAVPATVFPPGPLLPSSTAVETPDDLERSTAAEKIGIVLAVIAGPIGLVMAIVNAARSARRRGWLIGIVRASLVLGVLSSIAAGIAGYVLWNMRLDQIAHAETAAASAEFCAAAEVDPSMVTPPTLGWPAEGASVSESLTTMQAWTDRWAALAASSPAKLQPGVERLAEAGQAIVDSVTQARVVDDATNQAQISAVAGQSGVAGWHATYCVAP